MKKYMTQTGYYPSIEVVEADRETDISVWIDGRRHNKMSDYDSYFDTLEQAKAHVVQWAVNNLDLQKKRVEVAYELLRKAETVSVKDGNA